MPGTRQAPNKRRLYYASGLEPPNQGHLLRGYLSEVETQHWNQNLAPDTKLNRLPSAAWKARRSPLLLHISHAYQGGLQKIFHTLLHTHLLIFRIQPQWLDTRSIFMLLRGQRTPIKMSKLKIVLRAKKQMRRESRSLWFNTEFCIKALCDGTQENMLPHTLYSIFYKKDENGKKANWY